MRVVTASSDKTARVWDARTGQPVGAPLEHAADIWSAVFSPDGTRIVTASRDKTARVWGAPAGTPSDADILADAARALSGYAVNQVGGLIRVDDAASSVMALRQKLAGARSGEPTAASILHWLLEDPWERTISPLSGMTVSSYIDNRLKQCTDEARSEAESRFLGHPLFVGVKGSCPGGGK
jgi:hypothetical protein